MNEQELQELNKKLAEWRGFTQENDGWWDTDKTIPSYVWIDPDGNCCTFIERQYNFTQSLDACLKHLVPKAIDEIMAEHKCSSDVAYAILFKKWLQELELIIPKAALALCLAIEKMIGGK